MRLLLDHHCASAIAEGLRARGYQCVTAVELDLHELDDTALLEWCVRHRYTLVTNDVVDFVAIAQRWAQDDRTHAGIVLHSDRTITRAGAHTGWFVERLARLADEHPGDDELADQIRFTTDL